MVSTRKRKTVTYNESDSDFERDEEVRSIAKIIRERNQKKKAKREPTPVEESDKDSFDEEEEEEESEVESASEEEEEEEEPTTKKKTVKKVNKQEPSSKKTPEKETTKKDANKQDTSKKDTEDGDRIYDFGSTNKSDIVIPRPKGSPFADAISPDTMEFMAELAENNDRDFMHLKSKEWAAVKKDFIGFCSLLMKDTQEVDPTILAEEPKNAMYRQHRDLRFSNDKTPYKTYLSASFSRSGRKFINAGYYLLIQPGNKTMVAAGMWQPPKEALENMRQNIIRHGDLFREAISTDAIKDIFDGKFGVDILEDSDKLKNGPKGIEKDHPEIELLKFRSFAIRKRFTDEEVVSPGFEDKVMDVWEALVPFVTVINTWV